MMSLSSPLLSSPISARKISFSSSSSVAISASISAHMGNVSAAPEVEFLERLYSEMENGKTARAVDISEEEEEYLKEVSLLTIKPVIYACNMSEDDFANGIEENKNFNIVKEIAAQEGGFTVFHFRIESFKKFNLRCNRFITLHSFFSAVYSSCRKQ